MVDEPVVLISDPRVVAIPVVECDEPLQDVRDQPALHIDPRKADPAGAFARLRAGVLDRLAHAQGSLPEGLHLLIVEGYRPMHLQQAHFSEYEAELALLHPDLPPQEVAVLGSRYIAPPEAAPHPAGAAVDLTLCTAEGVELDLGTPVNASPEESAGACYFSSPLVRGEARANREMLAGALAGAGLVNYPTEWWHWSYGDRYWAHATGTRQARYGPVPSRTFEA